MKMLQVTVVDHTDILCVLNEGQPEFYVTGDDNQLMKVSLEEAATWNLPKVRQKES